jgi:hypothetical protein
VIVTSPRSGCNGGVYRVVQPPAATTRNPTLLSSSSESVLRYGAAPLLCREAAAVAMCGRASMLLCVTVLSSLPLCRSASAAANLSRRPSLLEGNLTGAAQTVSALVA